MELPLVSVIIPVYNGEEYLAATLASVRRQTYSNLEIIVSDDGSTDSTAAITRAAAETDPRIRYVTGPNGGVGAARNRGIEVATGDFIAPLDADDLWYSDKIGLQVARMLESPETVGLVYAWSVKIDTMGRIISEDFSREFEGYVLWRLLLQYFLGNASVPLIRRACFARVGRYREDLKTLEAHGCEDWDMALRIARHFEFRVVPRYLVGYRQSGDSMSGNAAMMVRSHEVTMEEMAERSPEIPSRIHRWSRALFYFYLHRRCVAGARYGSGFKWLLRALGNDPAQTIRPDLPYCLVSLFLTWFCDRVFASREAWRRPLRWLRPKSRLLPTLGQVQQVRGRKFKKRGLYEFIWQRRWQWVFREEEKARLHARSEGVAAAQPRILGNT